MTGPLLSAGPRAPDGRDEAERAGSRSRPLLVIDRVEKRFVRQPGLGERIAALFGAGRGGGAIVQAVNGVSLEAARGEVVGLVGESGCGKSTLGRMVAGVHAPSAGEVIFEGKPVTRVEGGRVRKLTTRVQMVHQDPFSSLDPRMRVGEAVTEGPVVHRMIAPREADAYAADMMAKVGLDPGVRRRYPHQFSGGQRQRVAIARALAMRPALVVLDEPAASLDVSIQAQVLNLFLDLRRDLSLTALFISHDLGVVRHVCDRVAIMYLGRIVELGPTDDLYAAPNHPYTRILFESAPRIGGGRRLFRPVAGEIPSPLAPPQGCHFHPRCPLAMPRCREEVPALKAVGPARLSACHLNDA